MIKNFFKKVLKTVVAAVVILGVAFGGYTYGSHAAGDVKVEQVTNHEKRTVTVEDVQTKLEAMNELTTYSQKYTVTMSETEVKTVFDDLKIPLTKNSIKLTASGIVKVGYDMSKARITLDENKIYIALPEAQLNDNYVIWDTVECEENNSHFNRIEFSQYQGLISDIEAKGLERAEEQNIYKLAEDNVKNIMDEFLAVFDGYEVVYM